MNKKHSRTHAGLVAFALAMAFTGPQLAADENYFGYTYGAEIVFVSRQLGTGEGHRQREGNEAGMSS